MSKHYMNVIKEWYLIFFIPQDPLTTPLVPPIAPPPAYDTPATSMAQDTRAVVPMVAETVRITPNTRALLPQVSPPENYINQTFPSSFSNDRLESAV